MKLFYIAAYGPRSSDPVWDRFIAAEDETEARVNAFQTEEFKLGPHFSGYTIQKVREMKLPPSHHFANYPLLGSRFTVGEWWRSFNSFPEEVRDGE